MQPTISTPVTFRQSATDADNHVRTSVAAAFVQDQIELSDHVQVLGGLRFDSSTFATTTTAPASRSTAWINLVSPRAGVVFKPVDASLDLRQLQRFLPAELRRSVLVADDHHAAGETGALQQLRGRREMGRPSGAVADRRGLPPRPHEHAVHRSKRPDPHRPDRQPAHQWLRARRQRAASRARGSSRAATPGRTRSSRARPRPHRKAPSSARCRTTRSRSGTITSCTRAWGPALGIIQRTDMFATIDDTVTLPGYMRVDAAAFLSG